MSARRAKRRLSRKARQRRAICVGILFLLILTLIIYLFVMISRESRPGGKGLQSGSSSESGVSGDSGEKIVPAITTQDDYWQLRLVNNQNGLEEGFEPPALKTVQNDYIMDERMANFMIDMILAAHDDGIELYITSAYRSVDLQHTLVENSVQEFKDSGYSEEDAYTQTYRTIAKPGHSEHNLGLAADIVSPDWYSDNRNLNERFENTVQFEWLDAHAHEYGFILRYPKDKVHITEIDYEPWHYRFVGTEHAAAIKEMDVCLEEYLGAAGKKDIND